ncbi:MAG TPA: ATP-binding protein, partial [Thermomicrobiales bacterium]|nr:ATP-binding protein [Thermomicrobiales bacterium]
WPLLALPVVAVAMHLLDVAAVAVVTALQEDLRIAATIRDALADNAAIELPAQLALFAIGVLAAIVFHAEAWAIGLLAAPIVGTWLALRHQLRLRAAGEQARQESETNLVEVQRLARLGNWEWDPVSGRLRGSAETWRILGLGAETPGLALDALLAIVHPDDRAAVAAALRGTGEPGSRFELDHRLRLPDGRERIVHAQAEARPGDDGASLRIAGAIQDVTETRQMEAHVRVAESRYRALVEQTPAVVYTRPMAAPATFDYISPRVRALLGYAPEEIVGKPGFLASRIHPDDRDALPPAELGRSPRRVRTTAQYRLRTRRGGWVWVRDEAVLIRDGPTEPAYWQGVLVDVTDLKLAEHALRQAKEAAEQADRSKSAFLSMTAHELRTPLTAIRGYIHLLREDAKPVLSAEQAADFDVVESNIDRLVALVTDLLDLARIEAGRLRLAPAPTALRPVVVAALRSLAPTAAPGVRFDVALPSDLPPLEADPDRLLQVLLNVIGNAVKFTERGVIAIAVRAGDDSVEIEVADTGIGIAPEALPHIFDEFRQADDTTHRRFGGAGLGLSIAKKLVELHGGAIEARNAPGAGAIFTIRLPVASVAAAVSPTSAAPLDCPPENAAAPTP